MKYYLPLIIILFTLSSCDKRSCECKDDMNTIVNNSSLGVGVGVGFDIQAPNAVLHEGVSLAFSISTNEEIDWTNQSIKHYHDNQVFIEAVDLTDYHLGGNELQFPNDNFVDDEDVPFRGALQVEFEIRTGSYRIIQLVGSIYFYNCEDIQDGFCAEDCRWPGQILSNPPSNESPC